MRWEYNYTYFPMQFVLVCVCARTFFLDGLCLLIHERQPTTTKNNNGELQIKLKTIALKLVHFSYAENIFACLKHQKTTWNQIIFYKLHSANEC